MARPKAKTMIEQLGFFDEDLKKPDHDTIMMWLQDHVFEILNLRYKRIGVSPGETLENARIKAEAFVAKRRKFYQDQLAEEETKLAEAQQQRKDDWWINSRISSRDSSQKSLNFWQSWLYAEPPEPGDIKIKEIKWEQPVQGKNGFIIGYIDLVVVFDVDVCSLQGAKENSYDLPKWETWKDTCTACFEVKTEMPTLGELFRQINTYRTYLSHGKFFVVCPDDTHKAMIEGQGVGFVKPDL